MVPDEKLKKKRKIETRKIFAKEISALDNNLTLIDNAQDKEPAANEASMACHGTWFNTSL
ncbi:MAG TPA: hypothetical protein VMF08_08050 [Candidatus Sulfotelmatobacter sp.]|nr:hypothetical protein [Candidatus Sulfotelmatobacter sp.]